MKTKLILAVALSIVAIDATAATVCGRLSKDNVGYTLIEKNGTAVAIEATTSAASAALDNLTAPLFTSMGSAHVDHPLVAVRGSMISLEDKGITLEVSKASNIAEVKKCK